MNSKLKGKRAELAFASFLRDHGFDARRGVQFHGGADSPDVVSNLPFHIEVKNCQRVKLRDWVAQAEGDARGKNWVVAHRWNGGQWLVTFRAEDFLALVREALPPSSPSSISTLPTASCDVDTSAEPQTQNQTELKGTVMKLTEAFPSKWLKAADLDGEPRLVTIESVKLEAVEEGKPAKPVVVLRGMNQGLVLNKTNGNTIAAFLGDDTDGWSGKKIVLFPTQAEFQGRMTDCIRVRAPKPAPVATTATAAKTVAAPVLQSKVAEAMPTEDDVPF